MTDRIDRYFDGALEWTALTPEERAAAASIERAIHETRAAGSIGSSLARSPKKCYERLRARS